MYYSDEGKLRWIMSYTNVFFFCSNKVSPTTEKINSRLWSSLMDLFCLIYVCNFHGEVIPVWMECVTEYLFFNKKY